MTAAPPSTEASSQPAHWAGWGDVRPAGSSRIGWLWAAVWLVYLASPIRGAWRHLPDPSAAVAIVALLLFAVLFAGYFAWVRRYRMHGRQVPSRVAWAELAGMVALLAVAAPGAGEDILAGTVYVGVTAAMVLPLRQALVAVGAVTAATFVLPRVVHGWTPVDSFVPQLLLASFAAYGVGTILKRNVELARAREQLVGLAVTQERERVARDVHDILGHSLTVITVKTELAGRLLDALPASPALDRARTEVGDAERLAREALADVRATVSGMRQVSLTGELAAARQALDAAGIRAELPSAADDVPARFRDLFAWVLREGVTNVVRHSGAAWCGVRLTPDRIEVRDDGRGPGGDDGRSGNGLAGLRSRAAGAGARLETGRAPEGGFLLRVVAEGAPA